MNVHIFCLTWLFKILHFRLFSKRTKEEIEKIGTSINTPEDCPEGISLLQDETRPVIELHMVKYSNTIHWYNWLML